MLSRKISGAVFVLYLIAGSSLAVAKDDERHQEVGPLEIVTPSEFLKLPDSIQAFYVGGLIEGMSFVSYGYSLPDHREWTACVRQKTLGDTANDVVNFIGQTPEFHESIASALAQTIGKRCRH